MHYVTPMRYVKNDLLSSPIGFGELISISYKIVIGNGIIGLTHYEMAYENLRSAYWLTFNCVMPTKGISKKLFVISYKIFFISVEFFNEFFQRKIGLSIK